MTEQEFQDTGMHREATENLIADNKVSHDHIIVSRAIDKLAEYYSTDRNEVLGELFSENNQFPFSLIEALSAIEPAQWQD